MDQAAAIMIAIIIVILLGVISRKLSSRSEAQSRGKGRGAAGRTNTSVPWPSKKPAKALGVPLGHPARTAAERLEIALDQDFESRVKERVLLRYPKIKVREWNWTWFELKRYFLMCGIMRSVPMYSKQVDAVWHEMLMFTREYEQFCTSFSGEMIHHAPHASGAEPLPGERALFDWVYGELFQQAPASGRLWGAFYRSSMPEQKLEELAGWSEEELRKRWFNVKTTARHTDLNDTVGYLIDRAKSQLSAAGSGKLPHDIEEQTLNRYHYDPIVGATGIFSGLLIYHSFSNPDDFVLQMDKAQNAEERKANGSGDSTYGCNSTSDDRGSSDSDSGGDSSCGSGGGSSCGGGGCGGGGD